MDSQPQGMLASWTGLAQVANAGLSLLSTNTTSLVTTVTNYMSDDAAFAKLGFPPKGAVNEAELAKYKGVIVRHNNDTLNNAWSSEQFKNDVAFLNRRQGYVKRAVEALENYADGFNLATFILTNYNDVMTTFEKTRVAQFLLISKKSAEVAIYNVNQLSNDNIHGNLIESILNSSRHIAENADKKNDGDAQQDSVKADDTVNSSHNAIDQK
jgi:hypothetical protein